MLNNLMTATPGAAARFGINVANPPNKLVLFGTHNMHVVRPGQTVHAVKPIKSEAVAKGAHVIKYTRAKIPLTPKIAAQLVAADIGPIVVTDIVPAGLTFASGRGTKWKCMAKGQVVKCWPPTTQLGQSTNVVAMTVRMGERSYPGVATTAVSSPYW